MRVELLGTGTSQGVPVIMCECEVCLSKDSKDKRLRVSVSIQTQEKSIVVDIGPDFRQQMLRSGIQKIDSVLLTHEHNDHIIGMDDLRPYNFKQGIDIPVIGSAQVLQQVKEKFHYAFTKQPYPGAPRYELRTIKHGDNWKDGDISITAFEVMHGQLPILCYRFNDFVYITDAKTISEESLKLIENCDTLIINALRNEKHWSHLTLKESLEYINRINPKKAYLTHISHLLGKHKDVENKLPKNVHLCYDGLVFEV